VLGSKQIIRIHIAILGKYVYLVNIASNRGQHSTMLLNKHDAWTVNWLVS